MGEDGAAGVVGRHRQLYGVGEGHAVGRNRNVEGGEGGAGVAAIEPQIDNRVGNRRRAARAESVVEVVDILQLVASYAHEDCSQYNRRQTQRTHCAHALLQPPNSQQTGPYILERHDGEKNRYLTAAQRV